MRSRPVRVRAAAAERQPIFRAPSIVPLIPASSFGIALGLGGLANGWRVAAATWDGPRGPGELIFAVAAATWLAAAGLYGWKWIAAPDLARAEAHHPVQCCFIGLGGVATMVMAQGALPYSRSAAWSLFAAGALFTVAFGIWRTGMLLQGRREVEATTPVLFLPIVAGGFVIAITAGALGLRDWAALAFGAAFFSWLAIESVVLHRLYTAAPLPPALRPVLGIELAPPTVGALAYLASDPGPALFLPEAMIGYALLQALLLARLWRWIGEQRFAPSYWAITFGVTALPAALIRISARAPSHAFAGLALVLFAASNVIVAVIAVRTIGLWLPRSAERPA